MKKLSIKQKAAIAANALLCAVLWSGFVYGCIVFVGLEQNPLTWSSTERLTMTLFGFVGGVIIGVLRYLALNDRQSIAS